MARNDVRRWLRRLPPGTLAAGVAVAVAAAMALTISVADEPDAGRAPDALAYLLGVTVAVMVLVARRWPMGALTGSVGVLLVYYGLDYPAFSPAVPLAAAAFFAALAGHVLPAAALLAGVVALGAGWQTIGEDASVAAVVGRETLTDAALLAAVLLLGEAVRSRRAWAAEVRDRQRRAELDRERETARRVAEERLRIARDVHDVVSHTVAALNVQAAVAADVIDEAPDQAKASLRTIREQAGRAIAELRATLGPLRDGADTTPRVPTPGLVELPFLVENVSAAGVEVELSVTGDRRELPGTVELAAYRILQESLTNVIRHAHATTAAVLVRFDPEAIVVQVDDDGRGPVDPGDAIVGLGLAGMRERAAAVGGTLNALRRPGGGFRVHARLPAP